MPLQLSTIKDEKECTKCKAFHPNTDEYFHHQFDKSNGKMYLSSTCKRCRNLQSHVHYQKNKKATNKRKTLYMRIWREKNRAKVNAAAKAAYHRKKFKNVFKSDVS